MNDPNIIKAVEADDLALYIYQVMAEDIPLNLPETRARVRAKLRTAARAFIEGVPVLEVDEWIERSGSLWNKENEVNASVWRIKRRGA
tara:strand:- start:542 stop:805 length:264 start_codon:yes stop_codon:yes gene_type:complete